MRNFLIGLAGLVGGAVLWIVASFLGALGEFGTGEVNPVAFALMAIGFLVMIGMPIAFWVVIPLAGRRRRQG